MLFLLHVLSSTLDCRAAGIIWPQGLVSLSSLIPAFSWSSCMTVRSMKAARFQVLGRSLVSHDPSSVWSAWEVCEKEEVQGLIRSFSRISLFVMPPSFIPELVNLIIILSWSWCIKDVASILQPFWQKVQSSSETLFSSSSNNSASIIIMKLMMMFFPSQVNLFYKSSLVLLLWVILVLLFRLDRVRENLG